VSINPIIKSRTRYYGRNLLKYKYETDGTTIYVDIKSYKFCKRMQMIYFRNEETVEVDSQKGQKLI
jgi:hypothetical protein